MKSSKFFGKYICFYLREFCCQRSSELFSVLGKDILPKIIKSVLYFFFSFVLTFLKIIWRYWSLGEKSEVILLFSCWLERLKCYFF